MKRCVVLRTLLFESFVDNLLNYHGMEELCADPLDTEHNEA